MTGACSTPLGSRRTSASPASFISGVWRIHRKTVHGRRLTRSRPASPQAVLQLLASKSAPRQAIFSGHHVLRDRQQRPRTAARSVQGDRRTTAHRLDHVDERQGEINLAPYSFFNAVSDKPPIVLFSSEGRKDSLVFIEETKEFVCNLPTFDLRAAVDETGYDFPRGVNEMREAGLEPAPCRLVGRHGWRPRRARSSASCCRSST